MDEVGYVVGGEVAVLRYHMLNLHTATDGAWLSLRPCLVERITCVTTSVSVIDRMVPS